MAKTLLAQHIKTSLDAKLRQARDSFLQKSSADGFQMNRSIGGTLKAINIDDVEIPEKESRLRPVNPMHVAQLLSIIERYGFIDDKSPIVVQEKHDNPTKYIAFEGSHRIQTLKECKNLLLAKDPDDQRAASIRPLIRVFGANVEKKKLKEIGVMLNHTHEAAVSFSFGQYVSAYIHFAKERKYTATEWNSRGRFASESKKVLPDVYQYTPTKEINNNLINLARFILVHDSELTVWNELENVVQLVSLRKCAKEISVRSFSSSDKAMAWFTIFVMITPTDKKLKSNDIFTAIENARESTFTDKLRIFLQNSNLTVFDVPHEGKHCHIIDQPLNPIELESSMDRLVQASEQIEQEQQSGKIYILKSYNNSHSCIHITI